jgi:hypothetical protein
MRKADNLTTICEPTVTGIALLFFLLYFIRVCILYVSILAAGVQNRIAAEYHSNGQ